MFLPGGGRGLGSFRYPVRGRRGTPVLPRLGVDPGNPAAKGFKSIP